MSFERRKVRVGRVVGDKMDKTVVVQVEWRRAHPLYKKSMRRNSRFKVHDSDNECRIGDLVRIVETRPLSRFKRWRVDQILAREEIAEIQPEEIAVDEVVESAVAVAEPAPMESGTETPEAEEPESAISDEIVRAEQEEPAEEEQEPEEPAEAVEEEAVDEAEEAEDTSEDEPESEENEPAVEEAEDVAEESPGDEEPAEEETEAVSEDTPESDEEPAAEVETTEEPDDAEDTSDEDSESEADKK